ncbi:LD-carboxypeptidase [Cellulophaga sp. Hel_I_12]|uniref:S66 peptidase family protein n=1 Tax=Cellulophaga sp. Hel_I_12 TaxID=1249972 RepID=UPI000648CF22|nr:LD-carboxypeptidase [Cellulophaga sp. Hel_I_12]
MKTRRHFFRNLFGVSTVSLFPFSTVARIIEAPHHLMTIKPNRLKIGDTIGLIAPASAIKEDVLEAAKETLRSLGFIPYHTHRILGNHGYFSNTDEERATDLNEMFANPNVHGILCARGGYGCTRIMQSIDYDLIKKNPKVLLGFSDITALANGIYKKTGLITFHGPVGSTLNNEYSIEQLENILITPKDNLRIENVSLDDTQMKDSEFERYTINSGKATGKLVGGSLTLITAMIGTPHEIDFTGTIVCIEDVEEAPYRMDRMLTQLLEGPTFKKAAAVMLGVSKGCDKPPKPDGFTLKEVMIDRIKPLNIPAAYGMSFGHVDHNFTIPIGIAATFDADAMTLDLLETAVK